MRRTEARTTVHPIDALKPPHRTPEVWASRPVSGVRFACSDPPGLRSAHGRASLPRTFSSESVDRCRDPAPSRALALALARVRDPARGCGRAYRSRDGDLRRRYDDSRGVDRHRSRGVDRRNRRSPPGRGPHPYRDPHRGRHFGPPRSRWRSPRQPPPPPWPPAAARPRSSPVTVLHGVGGRMTPQAVPLTVYGRVAAASTIDGPV